MTAKPTKSRPVFTPATDVFEREDAFLLICSLPGVEEKDLDIHLEKNELTLTATQKEHAPEGFDQLVDGYRSGVFKRSFALSNGIDQSKADAQLTDGVLRLTLPKVPDEQPRKIPVNCS